MRIIILYFITCVLAALVPFRPIQPPEYSVDQSPYPFPDQYQGQKLKPIAMTERERQFYRNFPGRISKMTDGNRHITYKWIERPTRRLHPASDCYRGIGYSIHHEPIRMDDDGQRWGAFMAKKGHQKLRVKEKITDPSNLSWTDVSSWYWSAFLGRSRGPWLVITVSEGIAKP